MTETTSSSTIKDEEAEDFDEVDSEEVSYEKRKQEQQWDHLKTQVDEKLCVERLRQAYITRNEEELSMWLMEMQERFNFSRYEKDITKAERGLKILIAARELKTACDDGDEEEIKQSITSIKRQHLTEELSNEIRAARYELEALEQLKRTRQKSRQKFTGGLDRAALSALRRIQNPPPAVHEVMQAVLLLLGEDEDTTDNWKEIQRLLGASSSSSVHQRLLNCQAGDIEVELVARSKQILDNYDIEQLRKVNQTVYLLYAWAKGIIKDAEPGEQEPADRARQRVLLGRAAAVANIQMDRKYYYNLAIKKDQSPDRRLKYAPERRHLRHRRDNPMSMTSSTWASDENEQQDYY